MIKKMIALNKIHAQLMTYKGCQPHLAGFRQTAKAVEIYIDNPSIKTMELYKEVAKSFGISPRTLERNIRLFKEKLGLDITNAQFIAEVAYRVGG